MCLEQISMVFQREFDIITGGVKTEILDLKCESRKSRYCDYDQLS